MSHKKAVKLMEHEIKRLENIDRDYNMKAKCRRRFVIDKRVELMKYKTTFTQNRFIDLCNTFLKEYDKRFDIKKEDIEYL